MDAGSLTAEAGKAPFIAAAYKAMGYDVCGIAPSDAQRQAPIALEKEGIAMVSVSDLPPSDSRRVPRSRVCKVNGHTIGFTAVSLPPMTLNAPVLLALDSQEQSEQREKLFAALKAELRTLRPRCEITVLLSQLLHDDNELFAERLKGSKLLDVIIPVYSGTQPMKIGDTVIAPTETTVMCSRKQNATEPVTGGLTMGRCVGVLDVTFASKPTFQWALVPLHPTITDDPRLQTITARYRQWQQQQMPAPRVVTNVTLQETGYIPAEQCGTCHPREFAIWKKQPHAHAHETLRKVDKLLPDCLRCHSQEFRATQRAPAPSYVYDGVQCSTCHGSGLEHVKRPSKSNVTRGKGVCISCHDPKNDPDFNGVEAMKRIDHWSQNRTPLQRG